MEENETTVVTGNVATSDTAPAMDGYVAPEVAAAQAGEQVDFSMHVYVEDDPALGLVNDLNADPADA
jgi:hypothetical protein